jgi:hypothetical protein
LGGRWRRQEAADWRIQASSEVHTASLKSLTLISILCFQCETLSILWRG